MIARMTKAGPMLNSIDAISGFLRARIAKDRLNCNSVQRRILNPKPRVQYFNESAKDNPRERFAPLCKAIAACLQRSSQPMMLRKAMRAGRDQVSGLLEDGFALRAWDLRV